MEKYPFASRLCRSGPARALDCCMQKIGCQEKIPHPMLTLDFHPTGRHFLQIPGPSPVPDRILRAMSLPDHRPPRPRVRRARPEGARGHPADVQDPASGGHLSGLGHRRLGGGAGQHAEPGRHRADVRDRPLRHAVEEDGRAPRPEARVPGPAGHRRAGAAACRPT